jgi:pSer/pThr/pTyr-binding forkhead associated (FHA) protein
MAYLIRKNPDNTPAQQWEVGEESVRVGRGEESEIRVDDAKMSRTHFAIEWRAGVYHIVDMGSTNGTWVNDERIREKALEPEDRIVAGRSVFVFQSGFGSMIERLAQEPRSYTTRMRKIPIEFHGLESPPLRSGA